MVSEGWYWVQPDSHPSFATSTLWASPFPSPGPSLPICRGCSLCSGSTLPNLGHLCPPSQVSPPLKTTCTLTHLFLVLSVPFLFNCIFFR